MPSCSIRLWKMQSLCSATSVKEHWGGVAMGRQGVGAYVVAGAERGCRCICQGLDGKELGAGHGDGNLDLLPPTQWAGLCGAAASSCCIQCGKEHCSRCSRTACTATLHITAIARRWPRAPAIIVQIDNPSSWCYIIAGFLPF